LGDQEEKNPRHQKNKNMLMLGNKSFLQVCRISDKKPGKGEKLAKKPAIYQTEKKGTSEQKEKPHPRIGTLEGVGGKPNEKKGEKTGTGLEGRLKQGFLPYNAARRKKISDGRIGVEVLPRPEKKKKKG